MSIFETVSKQTTTIPATNNAFFSPAIQRQTADISLGSGVEKSCETFFADSKDLAWAAAKHFLDTEMPSLFTPTPTKFDCFDDKGIKGCTITLKNNSTMLVYYTEKFVHVQRPSPPGEAEMGFCNYYYSCDEGGNITFKERDCLRTW